MTERSLYLGFSDKILLEAEQYGGLHLGRVIGQYKDLYRVATEKTELFAEITGKFRYSVGDQTNYPAVGDFVMIDRVEGEHGNAMIHNILKRKSAFIRKAAGTSHELQVIATNIDSVFICMSLNKDFNLRRLERYLAITWDSGAKPIVVLTKSDLSGEIDRKILEIEKVALAVDIVVTSSMVHNGHLPILQHISPGMTVAFIGSSGVGKSTIINKLIGESVMETGEIRNDDKGRHITTTRELFIIPDVGTVIDTPGMRELGIESANFEKTFADIDEIASNCRFKDCQHENEPGCAVKKAIQDGIIDAERFISYKKLNKEAKYEGLNSRQIEKEKISDMFSEFEGIKNAKKYMKSKKKT